MNIYRLGIIFDSYTPAVENAIIRDILSLQDRVERWPNSQFSVVCESNLVDRMLNSLGITRTSEMDEADVYTAYQTRDRHMDLPITDKKVFVRKLYQEKSDDNRLYFRPGDPGYPLQTFERDLNYNPFDRQPPSSTAWGPGDPLVYYIWSK